MAKKTYTKTQINRMAASVPWEDLTPAERKIMGREFPEKVTPGEIARYTSIPLKVIRARINQRRRGGINPRTLQYRASRGFYGFSKDGRQLLILYVVYSNSDSTDFSVAFGTAKEIEDSVHEKAPCPSPPCDDENEATVSIPLKNGERNNLPEGSKEIEG